MVEILAPGGSYESTLAAFYSGADAVYAGVSKYSARAFAKNITVDKMCELLDIGHIYGKKIYLTLNTILYDGEIEGVKDLIMPLYENGLDAVIVQDVGVINYLHREFKDLDIHLSTQMSMVDGETAKRFTQYGITRVVPARELTIDEIRAMKKTSNLEMEVFVHGALCYCYSGQCMMSKSIGDRSANRGTCAQTCRLNFSYGNEEKNLRKYGYLLNTKDLCTLAQVGQLIEAGVDSFKIEGRMKKKPYAIITSNIYKKVASAYESGLDLSDKELVKDINRMADIFNRGGFTSGFAFEKDKMNIYYSKKNNHYGVYAGKVESFDARRFKYKAAIDLNSHDVVEIRDKSQKMIYQYTLGEAVKRDGMVTANYKRGVKLSKGLKIYRVRNNELIEEIEKIEEEGKRAIRKKVDVRFFIDKERHIAISISDKDGNFTHVSGNKTVDVAQNKPTSKEDILKKIKIPEDDIFVCDNYICDMEDNLFIPMGEVKKLRRRALEEFANLLRNHFHRDYFEEEKEPNLCLGSLIESIDFQKENVIRVYDLESLYTILDELNKHNLEEYAAIHIPFGRLDIEDACRMSEICRDRGVSYLISLPPILRENNKRIFMGNANRIRKECNSPLFMGTIVDSFDGIGYVRELLGNLMENKHIIASWRMYCKNKYAYCFYKGFGIDLFLYTALGPRDVMISEGCVHRTVSGCDKKATEERIYTPYGDEFVARNYCDYCINIISEARGGYHAGDGYSNLPEIVIDGHDEMHVRRALYEGIKKLNL